MRRAVLYGLFFLSGVSALIYELAWQRMLTLVFGVSTLSVSAVLAAFMGGLALGGFAFGKIADRVQRPLRLYACLEVAIGIGGLLVPASFTAITAVYPGLFAHLCAGAWSGALLRLVLSLLVLALPATFLGATLPVMGRLTMRSTKQPAAAFSLFYAINTLGGVAGAALTGFILLRCLGLRQTLWIAAGLNFLVAALTLALFRRTIVPSLASPAILEHAVRVPAQTMPLVCAALTGAICTALEVIWSRILGILTSNSAYGFALLLTVLLAGLALGGLLQAILARRPGDWWRRLALCQWVLAGITLGTAPFFHVTPDWLANRAIHSSATALFLSELLLTAAALLVPALLMGMSIPLLVAAHTDLSADCGRRIGRIYAINTLGCTAGPFLAGFVFIPWLGIRAALGICLVGMLLVGSAAWIRSARTTRWMMPSAVLVCGAIVWLAIPWAPYLKSAVDAPRQLLYYQEGDNATVAVVEEPWGTRSILVDGQPVAGTSGTSVIDQKMLAHLPLLLHPDPHHALTVGFGSGGTSYSMSLHGIAVDCVEIEGRVPGAAAHFLSENHGVLDAPNYRLILDDARSWLCVAPQTYDVIVTDCTNIQYRANGDLYTTDYFQLMRGRLTPEGVAAAWVPANGIAPADLKTLLRSFHAVFPHTSVWFMNALPTDFVIVVGTPESLRVDLSAWHRRMQRPGVSVDLIGAGINDPCDLLFTLMTAEENLTEYLGDGPLNTDDRPVLSYSTYGATYRSTSIANLLELLGYRVDPTAYAACHPDPAVMLRQQAASNEAILGHLAHWAGDENTAHRHYARKALLLSSIH
jgi:spermidine synthase